jgi:hypothetical protein
MVGGHALGNVAQVAGEGRRPGQRDPRDRQLDRELAAVAAHPGQLQAAVEDDAALAVQEARQPAAVGLAQVGRDDELGHLAPVGLARGVAEDRLGGVVPPDDAPAGVHRHHRVESRLQHGPQP